MIHRRFGFKGLPERPEKPRPVGRTMMLDKGLSARQVEDALDVSAEYIDVVKLGWGTSVITPTLDRKIAIYHEAGVPVYFGGTLFEALYVRGQLDVYKKILEELEVRHVEVSDGSITLTQGQKLAVIEDLAKDFVVYSEVGSKDINRILPPYKWVQMIRAELEAGSSMVICEARESGTAGIFRPNGEVRSGLVDEIVDMVGAARVMFEAPLKSQQVWFIRSLGSNVNLGNIAPEEIIPLETLRLGLRADTLFEFFKAPTDGLAAPIGQSGEQPEPS